MHPPGVLVIAKGEIAITTSQQTTMTHIGDNVQGTKVNGDNVEGDKNTHIYYTQQLETEQSFQELRLDDYAPPRFAAPVRYRQMVETLRREHMLILHGKPTIGLFDLAYHMCWQAHTSFSATRDKTTYPIVRWWIDSDATSFFHKVIVVDGLIVAFLVLAYLMLQSIQLVLACSSPPLIAQSLRPRVVQ